ncbi:MAG: iron-sulfur cluster assembly accessory protein [Holosporaceae bacterium]|jgi:iron-sulfur cluster assembly protein|nr:iron-sulfur cluster assembly accessory protein [Holosporaceae bacterium]
MNNLIDFTQCAIDFMKKSVDVEKCDGIRIDVVSGGCCGMTYKLDFVKEINPSDLLIEKEGLKIYVAPRAAVFVSGMKMDYVSTPMGGNVVFENPNAKSTCGCGKSFCSPGADNACGGCCL